MRTLEGIVVPLLTPFTDDGSAIDQVALRGLVERLVAAGVHALLPNAGTSEFYHLDDDERRRETEIVVSQSARRVPVIAGVGAMATRQAIAFAKHAEAVGADGVFVLPPYYAPLAKPAIFAHLAAISDAISIPIMLYNNPFVTGVLLNPDDLAYIVATTNVKWIKLTTKVIDDIPIIRDRIGDDIPIFEGWDTLGFPAMCLGASGIVTAPANIMPDMMRELWRLTCVEHDLVAAEALNRRLTRFFDYVIRQGCFLAALKEMSAWMGFPLGSVRAPFQPLTEAQQSVVWKFAREFGLVAPRYFAAEGAENAEVLKK
ncbi:MAG TPA: dihydrodipicolinate synthase family protein [Anaerolineae bacterium]|nr:dihydrodipicolinate synthase family protein [Anaerolineae bacterium]